MGIVTFARRKTLVLSAPTILISQNQTKLYRHPGNEHSISIRAANGHPRAGASAVGKRMSLTELSRKFEVFSARENQFSIGRSVMV